LEIIEIDLRLRLRVDPLVLPLSTEEIAETIADTLNEDSYDIQVEQIDVDGDVAWNHPDHRL
jgi:hypothetical protein